MISETTGAYIVATWRSQNVKTVSRCIAAR